jgi:hypothetical protein
MYSSDGEHPVSGAITFTITHNDPDILVASYADGGRQTLTIDKLRHTFTHGFRSTVEHGNCLLLMPDLGDLTKR